MKKFVFVLMSFLITSTLYSQIVINEVMYAPTSPNKEWFELYNLGTSAVNVQNWKWRDAAISNPVRTITTLSVTVNPNDFVIICEDSTNFRSAYPGVTALVIQSIGWNALNNTGIENIVLYNSSSVTIDSLTYNNTWGAGSGNYSLERKNPAGPTNQQSNWGQCIDPNKATPGRANSLTPKQYDLILSTFNITPNTPIIGDTLKFNMVVKNAGLNIANTFNVKLYYDINKDSIPQPGELIGSQNYTNLNPGDSVTFYQYIPGIDSGFKQYIGYVEYIPDMDTMSNKLVKSVNVGGQVVSNGIIINEIMYAPTTPEPEWFEIFNNSGSAINLKNWKFSDSSAMNNPITITSSDYIIQANSYVVLTKSSSIFQVHSNIDSSKVIIISNFPTLNNDRDRVSIYNNAGTVIDYVSYYSSWGGSSRNSLERISPTGQSNDPANWATSIDCEYSSPTRQNSYSGIMAYEKGDIVINEIMYEPLSGNAEWVELFNRSGKNINLAGFKFNRTTYFYTLTDTCYSFLSPNSYLVIASDTSIYKMYSYLKSIGSNYKVVFRSNLTLSNDGDDLKLFDGKNTLIDEVSYSPKWHNPNVPDTRNFSLERINPFFPSNDRSNWSTCADKLGGTPDKQNSIYTNNPDVASNLSVSPNPFSPDGDGREDFTIISYKLKTNIASIRVKVYDVKGRLVRSLVNNQVSGQTGQIIFNGLDEEGNKLRIGIYILFLEAVDDRGGTVETLKTTVVIAAVL